MTAVLPARPRVEPVPGAAVLVRPAGPDDLHSAHRFFAGLSSESAYRRFFAGVGALPERVVRRFVEVDHDRRECLLALAGDAVVALADYARLADAPQAAEFGVVVTDGWQRRGLGPRLVTALLAIAAERGVTAARAHTLADNPRVHRLLLRRWPDARPVREDTLLIWHLPL
jgi:acetyltransferase